MDSRYPKLHARLAQLGVAIPRILLPDSSVYLFRWAVVACDQHTDNRRYWERVAALVGAAPSTLKLIIPEVYLKEGDTEQRLNAIRSELQSYTRSGVLRQRGEMVVLTRRTFDDGRCQEGVLMAVDVEKFEWKPQSGACVQASEEILTARIAPRRALRRETAMELPHALLLYNSPTLSLVRSMLDTEDEPPERLYQSDLMLGGGKIEAWGVRGERSLERLGARLESIFERPHDRRGSGVNFIVGDGNHSLAAAKSHWEELKSGGAPPEHPARYALVELINVHDKGLSIHPIHRLLYGIGSSGCAALASRLVERLHLKPAAPSKSGDKSDDSRGQLRVAWNEKRWEGELSSERPAVVEIARCIVGIEPQFQGLKTLYVHGEGELARLHGVHGGIALALPSIDPLQILRYVSEEGLLPPKSFSLGEAHEKRYYIEGRALVPEDLSNKSATK